MLSTVRLERPSCKLAQEGDIYMSSLRQLLANRENAKKSTGPVTPEGKAISSQNRVVHGLSGQFRVLAGEDQAAFDRMMNEFMRDEQPLGIAEVELVKKMVESIWLSTRARRYQEACFVVKQQTREQLARNEAEVAVRPELERYERYQAHHDRAYARAAAELLRRKKERRLQQNGFELSRRRDAEEKRRDTNENRRAEKHQLWFAAAQAKVLRELAHFEPSKAAASASISACADPSPAS
jgi:hypothetical protein